MHLLKNYLFHFPETRHIPYFYSFENYFRKLYFFDTQIDIKTQLQIVDQIFTMYQVEEELSHFSAELNIPYFDSIDQYFNFKKIQPKKLPSFNTQIVIKIEW